MAYNKTDKLIKYNNDYNRDNYDRISLMVSKGKKGLIQTKAKGNGESTNAFINRAIDMLLEDEQASTAALFSESELQQINALLKDGQTVDDYVRGVVLERVQKDTDRANSEK